MITLLIDTSSKDVSIAILKDKVVLSSITKETPNIHSVYTVKLISDALLNSNLKATDIEKIMVVTGPGSFTGLRIGVTIAKTYAYLNNIEIIPISSLKMRALSTNHDNCLSIIDAHHDNYYIGLYQKDNSEIIKEQFTTKSKVLDLINKYNPKIIGDIEGNIDNINYKKQELNVLKIVEYYKDKEQVNPHLVIPNYLKLPQALEEKK